MTSHCSVSSLMKSRSEGRPPCSATASFPTSPGDTRVHHEMTPTLPLFAASCRQRCLSCGESCRRTHALPPTSPAPAGESRQKVRPGTSALPHCPHDEESRNRIGERDYEGLDPRRWTGTLSFGTEENLFRFAIHSGGRVLLLCMPQSSVASLAKGPRAARMSPPPHVSPPGSETPWKLNS